MRVMLFTFFALFNSVLFSQIPDPNKFFPSAVGNVWEYSYSSGINRFEIVTDSLLDDSSKYIFYALNTAPVYRIDKNYNVFWMPSDSVLNWHYYKLNADSGDVWIVDSLNPGGGMIYKLARCRKQYEGFFYAYSTVFKEITFYQYQADTVINEFSWPEFTITIGYGIGEIMEFDEEGGGPQRILRGCIIDGDTIGIITSVKDEINTVKSLELFQNYPNPFNPTTTIKFTISEPQNVKLVVYSLLGEEIKVLVDEYKTTGSHSVAFNGNDLSSGVYIYSLIVGNNRLSKKLILLK